MNDAEGPMKRTILVAASIIVLLVFALVTQAGTGTRIRANIPFDFYAGERQLPAGYYIFEMRALGFGSSSSSAVAIYQPDGNFASLTPSMPTGYNARSNDGHLYFKRYGSVYFLSKIEGPQAGATMRATKAEKEYRAQTRIPRETVLLAVKLNVPAGDSDKSRLTQRPRLIVQQSDALR